MASKADLMLTADPGSSASKFIYNVQKKETPIALAMSPEVAVGVSVSSIKALQKLSMGSTSPINDAWLQIPPDSKKATVVGYLAQAEYQGNARLDLLKYEVIVPKFLAAIGAIAQQHDLGNKFSVAIACLLPFGEYPNKDELKTQLSKSLADFAFQGSRLSVELADFVCYPEGGGLAIYQRQQLGDEAFNKATIPVVMLGHRNSSLLLFEKGKLSLQQSTTTENGFINLVKQFCTLTSGQSPSNRLVEAIYQAGESPQIDDIKHLIRSQDEDNIQQEAELLKSVIKTAREDYWRSIKNWLDEVMPSRYSEVFLVGGVAQYLRQELTDYFGEKARYSDRIMAQIQEVFPQLEQSLTSRFLDVFALYCDVDEFEPPKPKGEREQQARQEKIRQEFAIR
ncbi:MULTISPECIES: ParM/StbA family protein [unclassified Coleofasciculus]|uniref:ParM/StbA family protein n=1 Tax=unclassified Coleofasciculus TaxID=2692782 RepID=UPI00187DF645|nr:MULTISPECIES: ParM/StbA family protein [unclassified Coleofasciculus]MBE9124766.1 ParM/StbA family protein [Coleofasciculus sp. LEGE 07081]MBE9148218.1 ParM/StbA family protein [Coleofasciculus sp. LEGE 07092]